MSKIAIDLGHGVGQDRGANGLIAEETIINSVGSLVINKLKALGNEVIEVRPSSANSVGNSLSQRVNKANTNNCDLFVSIHANAGGGKGTEVFTYNAKEVSQARNVLNNIVALGFNNRGIKDGKNLYVVRHSNMTAMLIEICFVDTKNDVDLYNSLGVEKIADAIVKGLVGQTTTANATQTVQASQPQVNGYSATVRDFQRQYNETYGNELVVDGIWGANTENALHKVLLKVGSKNSLVSFVQCRVGASIDCDFGNNTRQKVIEYQRSHGLIDDGVVGYHTIRCILNQFK